MARCTNCHYRWKTREVISLGFSKNGKACPKCEDKQFISAETQRIFTLGYLSLLLVPLLFFRIKLSDKEESMW